MSPLPVSKYFFHSRLSFSHFYGTFFFFKVLFYLFIYLFIYGCVGSSFLREGLLQLRQVGATLLFIAVRRPLIIAASPVAEHRLQTRRLSNCGSRAQLLRGMWDPPIPGPEPVSPAPAGRLSTTAPPGKPHQDLIQSNFLKRHTTQ